MGNADSDNGSRQSARGFGRACAGVCIFLIRVYQVVLSPLLGGQCRYAPSCSHYAVDAYREHGVLRGTRLTVSRILRCHPFAKGGYDPVPPRER
ncbi:MAG: membrane protein insertion efficiency factor YidD [Planctomycetes bacterium]|nr:membrane protein insertion efficiency factor YidD [Planctomycetota bacterium]